MVALRRARPYGSLRQVRPYRGLRRVRPYRDLRRVRPYRGLRPRLACGLWIARFQQILLAVPDQIPPI
jgi:hypothetical protein